MEKIQMTLTVSADQAVKIARILAGENESTAAVQTAVQPQIQAAPVQAPITSAPVQAPISAPVTQAVQAPAAAPLPVQAPISAARTYTIEEIQAACAPLMDAGKQAELVGLLAQFGVQSLPQLTADQFGAFATALRGLGAKI